WFWHMLQHLEAYDHVPGFFLADVLSYTVNLWTYLLVVSEGQRESLGDVHLDEGDLSLLRVRLGAAAVAEVYAHEVPRSAAVAVHRRQQRPVRAAGDVENGSFFALRVL